MTNEQNVLLKLIRIALGGENKFSLPSVINWREVIDLSYRHGVSAVCCDGVIALADLCKNHDVKCEALDALDAQEISDLKYSWFSSCISREMVYDKHKKAIDDLTRLYGNNVIKMLLLKGYGLSLNYPIPNHRPVGDIDIFLFNDENNIFPAWKIGDKVIEKLGIKIDNTHHKHSVFSFEGQMVENHYVFLNEVAHRSTAEIEYILEDLVTKEQMIECDGFYIPSANFNALYLLRHFGEHFASVDASLRQVLDWALFIRSYESEIDWEWYDKVLDKVGMKKFLCVINSICVDCLGFNEYLFHGYLSMDKELVARVLGDILQPEFSEKAPSGFITGILFKYRRWKTNGWKHDLVFKESKMQSLLTQTWSHILKPSSLKN